MIGKTAHGAWAAVLVAVLGLGFDGRGVEAQERLSDFADKPFLVLDTGGHSASVRRLIFTQDEARLLSSGDDKVVRVWDLAGNASKLAWTIRPPIWRARAGAIYGMSLTSPDALGRQTLALGGYGVEALRGEIGLYRFPGAADRRQGDVEAYLASGDPVPLAQSQGHLNTVTSLEFSPDGTTLASASNDETVRLWDHRNHVQVGAPLIHPGPVNALAFTPDGRRLVTGGSDGFLRVWSVVAPRVVVAQAAPRVERPHDPAGLAINNLAVSPDGRWVVIGREDGMMLRYDLLAPELKGSEGRFVTGPERGPVEGLAIGPGGRLAASIVRRRMLSDADRPDVACEVQLRQVEDLERSEVLTTSANLVYALGFSPKGSYLAYAGGDRQDLTLVDFRAVPRTSIELAAPVINGRSVWDVGFVSNTSVAYSHEHAVDQPASEYIGFDLKDRARVDIVPAQVRRAVKEFDNWQVRPTGPYQLRVSRGPVNFVVELSPQLDGRWWNHTFIPPGPKHDRPILAIACDRGVAIYRLPDGVPTRLPDGGRTRFLDGHNGPVYTVAPSPDGKWLATGSADQSVRLWTLAGLDGLAPLGAEFELRGGALSVKSVERGSFADLGGMLAGDVVDQPALFGKRTSTPREFLDGYASVPPNAQVAYVGRRRKADGVFEEVRAGTTKRDRPSLSLFVGQEREWVLWMPSGYYDSSVIGDSSFLGWQVNRYSKLQPRPIDFYPMLTHEKALRQPKGVPGNAIDRLLDSADERVAFGPAPVEQDPAVLRDRPSRVTPLLGLGAAPVRGLDGRAIAAGSPLPEVFAMAPGPLVLDWKVEPSDAKVPGPFEVRREGETVRPAQAPPFDPAVGASTVQTRLDLSSPGSYPVTGLADVGGASERKVTVTARVDGEAPRKPARLRILTIAPSFADARISPIRASDRDARDLSPFLARHLVADSGGPFANVDPAVDAGLVGKDASVERISSTLDRVAQEPVTPGDLLVVVIETYVVAYPRGKALESHLVVSDTRRDAPTLASTIPAESIGSALESIVRRGGKVILVLDGTHATTGWGVESQAQEWARSLRNQHDVITVLATTRKPIADVHVEAHRPLAQALLDSIQAANPRPDDPLMTLADFEKAVFARVQQLTRQKGYPAVYQPTGIKAGFPILNRKP